MRPSNQYPDPNSNERQPLLRPANTNIVEGVDGESLLPSTLVDNESTCQQSDFLGAGTQLRVAAVMLCFFTTGMNVTAVGAFLLELERYYVLTDSAIASLFPVAVVGYISGTFLLPFMLPRHGWRGVAFVAPVLQTIGVMIISTAPPFSVVLLGHVCAGVGTGLSDAGFCAWASKLPYTNVVQGLMHGSYSIGCIVGPLVCTVVLKQHFEWYVFYRVMILLVVSVLAGLVLAFRSEDVHRFQQTHDTTKHPENKESHRARLVWLCGVFYFFYLSIECTFTNWIPAYMERVRNVNSATASMSSSVFWIGMALGRFMLGPVTQYFGLDTSVAVYIVLATCSESAFRTSQSYYISMMFLGGSGFFFAPMFPSGVVLLAAKLPIHEYVGGVALAAAIGQVGGAGAQVLIGFMAERLGLVHLIDAMLISSVLLLLSWIVFCKVK